MPNNQPPKKPAEQKSQSQRPTERDDRAKREAEDKRNKEAKPKTAR
ncbi:MAG TPA: hypothetical protein PLU35_10565 [Phycisphaerales bacterium]|nr:hypothetical protein [Phycisphaerales bacterium]